MFNPLKQKLSRLFKKKDIERDTWNGSEDRDPWQVIERTDQASASLTTFPNTPLVASTQRLPRRSQQNSIPLESFSRGQITHITPSEFRSVPESEEIWESWTPEILVDVAPDAGAALAEDIASTSRSGATQTRRASGYNVFHENRSNSRFLDYWNDDLVNTAIPCQQDAPISRRSCIICLEEQEYDRFPIYSTTEACNHLPNACIDCLQAHIKAEIKNKVWHDEVVKCPDTECGATLDYPAIHAHADKETSEWFSRRLRDQFLSTTGTFFSCPARHCNSGQEHASGDMHPIVTCIKCGNRFCFRHRVPWSQHATMTCAEFDAFLEDPANFRSQFELTNEAVEKEQAAEKKRRRRQEVSDRAFAQTLVEDQQREETEREAERDRQYRREQERLERAAEEETRRAARKERERKAQEKLHRQQEELLSLRIIDRTTKRCPKCGWPIEKNDGCDHMTCIKCKHEFYWTTLAAYPRART